MWVLATYQPTTFFSLKPSNATSSGGKTLLTPTPYAIKMGLLDAAIRTEGISYSARVCGNGYALCHWQCICQNVQWSTTCLPVFSSLPIIAQRKGSTEALATANTSILLAK